LIKGAILMALTILLFARMKTWIDKQRTKLMPE
jgi:riboflavin transporter